MACIISADYKAMKVIGLVIMAAHSFYCPAY
jgi:hypothetical protein